MKHALLLAVLLPCAAAHESCCEKAARLAKLRHIPDPAAVPPEFDAKGEPRLIPDASELAKPEGWSDEDDGPWEAPFVENPLYEWSAPLIDNPDYRPPTFLAELQSEVEKAMPWIVLGTLLTAALEALQLPVQTLGSFLHGAGPVGGALVGLATPLCSCGALPVAAGFVRGGVPVRAVVAFLTASQSAGLDSAALTWGLLGPAAALWRIAGAGLLAVAAGFAVPASVRAASPAPARRTCVAGALAGAGGALAPLRVALLAAVQCAADTFPPVLLGLAISAALMRWLPSLPNAPHELGSEGGLLARLAVLAASLPLQLCEHTAVTAAAAMQRAGGSAGLAFAFLLAAPATNLPSLLLLMSALRQAPLDRAGRPPVDAGAARTAAPAPRVAAARVSAAMTAAALLLSYAVDAAGVDLLVEEEAQAGAGSTLTLAPWFVRSSPWVAAALAFAALTRAVAGRVSLASAANVRPLANGCCRGDDCAADDDDSR